VSTAKECIIDINLRSEFTGSVALMERWTFSLRLGDQNPNQSERYQQEANYHKRLCVMVRTIKTISLMLPGFLML
jgi:alpha-galactosidase